MSIQNYSVETNGDVFPCNIFDINTTHISMPWSLFCYVSVVLSSRLSLWNAAPRAIVPLQRSFVVASQIVYGLLPMDPMPHTVLGVNRCEYFSKGKRSPSSQRLWIEHRYLNIPWGGPCRLHHNSEPKYKRQRSRNRSQHIQDCRPFECPGSLQRRSK